MSMRLDNLTEAQARRLAHYLRHMLNEQGIYCYTTGNIGCCDLTQPETETAFRDILLRLVPGRWADPAEDYKFDLDEVLSLRDKDYVNQLVVLPGNPNWRKRHG